MFYSLLLKTPFTKGIIKMLYSRKKSNLTIGAKMIYSRLKNNLLDNLMQDLNAGGAS